MDKVTWIVLVALAGSLLPLQAGLNARMGHAIHNPFYASLISFTGGVVALIIFILITRQPIAWADLKSAPKITWISGVFGAFYVAVSVLAFPRLGPALTFGLIVAGQLLVSIALDHFNILVAAPHPINWHRVAGALLIVAGVVIIRKF
jgi:transporter family-2 protein